MKSSVASVALRTWALCALSGAVGAQTTGATPPPAAQHDAAAELPRAIPPCRSQHLRLFVYTRQAAVRPRHRAIVERALQQRVAVHSSGFGIERGAPRLELGPVRKGVFHWRRREGEWVRVTSATRAWPFVAVAEYDGRDGARAWLDWFRRAKDARGGDGWNLDPADQRYARHLSDAYVRGRDERFAYLAVADTPTGDVVFANQWIVRARARWSSGSAGRNGGSRGEHVRGARVLFRREGAKLGDWAADVTPLVQWMPERTRGARLVASGAVPLPDPPSQLAEIGGVTVHTLPPIPPGVQPGIGFEGDDPRRR